MDWGNQRTNFGSFWFCSGLASELACDGDSLGYIGIQTYMCSGMLDISNMIGE